MPLLPSLISGLAVSASDLRSRRVPLPWVCAGLSVQALALACWCMWTCDWMPLVSGVALGAASALAQLALAMVKPGSLGFGDVTATALMGLAVGTRGTLAVAAWWLAMGTGGLATLGVACLHARRHGRRKGAGGPDDQVRPAGSIPFAPVIVAAAVVVVAATAQIAP